MCSFLFTCYTSLILLLLISTRNISLIDDEAPRTPEQRLALRCHWKQQ